jgi:polysaccharide chain length determinant protein (PEP-CTERM system associated)
MNDMNFFDETSAAPSGRPLAEYLEIPLRRPWLVLVPFVLIVAGSVVASRMVPEKYYTYTAILVESEKVPGSVGIKSADKSDRRLQTIRQEVLSGTRLEQVLADVNPFPESSTSLSLTDRVELLRGSLDVSPRGSDAFTIGCVHADPKTAAAVVNRIAELFVEEATRARAQQVEDANSFLDKEVTEARQTLEAKEEAVRRFKEAHMGTLPEQSTVNLSTLQRMQQQAQAVGDDLRGALTRQSDLEKQLADLSRGDATSSHAEGPQPEIVELRKQLASLRARYTDEHPDVRRILSRLAQLESRASSEPRTTSAEPDPVVSATEARLEQTKREVLVLEGKRNELEARITGLQSRLDATPRTEADLTTLSRDSGNLKEHYFALLNKKLDAQMAAKLEERWKSEDYRILDPARVPTSPFYPNRVMFITVGVVLGLLVGLAAAVLAHILDHSFKSLADVEALRYPVLSTIPYIKPRS